MRAVSQPNFSVAIRCARRTREESGHGREPSAAEPGTSRRIEPEAGIRGGSLVELPGEHRNRLIYVLVDHHARLAGNRPEDSTQELHDASLEPDGGGGEDGVERREVKALGKVTTSRR